MTRRTNWSIMLSLYTLLRKECKGRRSIGCIISVDIQKKVLQTNQNREGDAPMLMIDKAILDTNQVICNNITRFDDSERGLLSQNILAQLRNFVEYIAVKVYAGGRDIDPNDYQGANLEALKYLKSRGDLRFLNKFHTLLQKSVSHYTLDEGSSERLMLKYYEYLLKIKTFLMNTYNFTVLENLEDFPLNTDVELELYYAEIAKKICNPTLGCAYSDYRDRYYIQKIKPFFVDQRIYYEVTLTEASGNSSKFDRMIAFTQIELSQNYAVKLSIRNDQIEVLGKPMNIQIIDRWEISIRPCELDRLADIWGNHPSITGQTKEYQGIMRFLTKTGMSFTELVESDDAYYSAAKAEVAEGGKVSHIFDMLDKCRALILKRNSGNNVVRYLLYMARNDIIKKQYYGEQCIGLSNLMLRWECVPFDQMPYASSLRSHNPRLYDLFECIPSSGREHELFARYIRNNTEIEGKLFTPVQDIHGFQNIDSLIAAYNSALYYKHRKTRKIEKFHNYIYISEYAQDSAEIMRRLKKMSEAGINQYTASVDSWLCQAPRQIDSPEKKELLRKMFSSSQVALIYGAAGTGKSTMVGYISALFAESRKFYLANTNPAVDNLRRRVQAGNSSFKTIRTFLSKRNVDTSCDVLFIDECSTVSNHDMREILEKATFRLLVLVGDIFQIESIRFGNWFDIARTFISPTAVFQLSDTFRSEDKNLLELWNRVRTLDDAILELVAKCGYSARLDASVFERNEEDQIILCLNYDGLYGINNINRFLQSANPNPSNQWGINVYKVGDPVLFNESGRFSPLIYNNMKGHLVAITLEESRAWFDIELEIAINSFQASGYSFELVGDSESGNSIIRFSVEKRKSTDEDDDSLGAVMPFQVAYAVSIHKAQGLEYNTVKIIITNEVEERISHNIFYTAITRAKEQLKIYWSPETEKKVLSNLQKRDSSKDSHLLSQMYKL